MQLTEESKIVQGVKYSTASIPSFWKATLFCETEIFQRPTKTWVPASKVWSAQKNDWHVSFTDPTTSDVISVIVLASAWFGPLVLNILLNI